MKIALINDNSQSSKNNIIYNALKEVCDKKEYQLFNYGMTSENDKELTYVELGILAGILINSGAVDFIVTGCGTGEGACMALNSFPNVFCGLVDNSLDAYLFSQINGGNAISIPYAKGFGWGSELNLKYIFEKLFSETFSQGYPKERAESEKNNREYLKEIKKITTYDMKYILENIDKNELLKIIDRPTFKKYYFENATNETIKNYISELLNK